MPPSTPDRRPPAAAYLFWLQGALWAALDDQVVTAPATDRLRDSLGMTTVTGRVLETPTARFVQALPSLALDFVLAAGVAALIGALRRASHWGLPEAAGFAVTVLAPPLLLDSAFWNQTDSWVAAPLVWTMWALLRERFGLAGILYGLALLTKPQAILLGPTLLVVAVAMRRGEDGSWRRVARLGRSAAGGLLAIAVATAPFMIADANRPAGPLRWFARSYLATLGAEAYAGTTFNAFNVWWLHWMEAGATRAARDSTLPMLGTTRQGVGMAMLASGILLTVALAAWRGRLRRETWPVCAYLVCLAAFALPTGVHERYIYYCLPFLIALTALDWKRWLTPLILLVLVGTLEMTSFAWVTWVDGAVAAEDRARGSLLAVMTLAALACSFVALAAWPARRWRPG